MDNATTAIIVNWGAFHAEFPAATLETVAGVAGFAVMVVAMFWGFTKLGGGE